MKGSQLINNLKENFGLTFEWVVSNNNLAMYVCRDYKFNVMILFRRQIIIVKQYFYDEWGACIKQTLKRFNAGKIGRAHLKQWFAEQFYYNERRSNN